jgi:RimJ/RimL family protein N-acetyltransferase
VRKLIAWEHARVGAWIQSHGGGFYRPGGKCLGLEKDGELIAGVLYDYHNGASVYTHIAVAGSLDRHYLRAIFEYPFYQLRAKVLIGLVAETNTKSRKFVEHLGFKLTASIPEGHPEGSLLIYTLAKKDCRWLRKEDEQTRRPAAA